MAAASPSALARESLSSLKVLGFLYLKLGFFERAIRLFAALRVLDETDIQVAESLAYALLEANRPEESLKLLASLPAPSALQRLLCARALWRLDRREEARTAMDAYLATGKAAP